jgi:hypothetical protein
MLVAGKQGAQWDRAWEKVPTMRWALSRTYFFSNSHFAIVAAELPMDTMTEEAARCVQCDNNNEETNLDKI